MLQVRIAVTTDGRTEGMKIDPSSAAFSRSRCENLGFPPFVRSFHERLFTTSPHKRLQEGQGCVILTQTNCID